MVEEKGIPPYIIMEIPVLSLSEMVALFRGAIRQGALTRATERSLEKWCLEAEYHIHEWECSLHSKGEKHD